MKTLARCVLAAALFLSTATLRAEAPLSVKIEPVRVSERAYYVQGKPGVASRENEGFNSNAGFVVTPEGVVVIDALGTPALGRAFIDAIRTVTDKPIKRVLVTHYHADHIYGLSAFKALGAEIWAHREAVHYLEGGEGARRLEQRRRDLAPWVDAETRLVPPDRWLTGDERFELGGVRFELVYMGPAHAPDDLVVVLPDDHVIFTGDIIFSGRIPFVGEADSKRWLETIDRLLGLRAKVLVPGHGQVSRDPARDLELTRDYLKFLREAMGRAVEDFIPFDEAYAATDWSRFAHLPAFDAANRINAYGTYLLMERELLQR
ncbi:MAG TPA: MBL fold metallo-hydrolase [Burkholderiales bacterium]